MVVHGHRQNLLGPLLADHVGVELLLDFARGRDVGEERLGNAAPLPLLVEDLLAKLDAIAADVNVARAFHQGADIAIALAAERAKGVLLGAARGSRAHVATAISFSAAPSRRATARDVLTRWHALSFRPARETVTRPRRREAVTTGCQHKQSRPSEAKSRPADRQPHHNSSSNGREKDLEPSATSAHSEKTYSFQRAGLTGASPNQSARVRPRRLSRVHSFYSKPLSYLRARSNSPQGRSTASSAGCTSGPTARDAFRQSILRRAVSSAPGEKSKTSTETHRS